MKRRLLNVYILMFVFCCGHAQPAEDPVLDSLQIQLNRYTGKVPHPEVYLHLDKTVYVQSEYIWFTAYWLNKNAHTRLHTLHVVLTEEASHKQILYERFVMDSGLAKGMLLLGDTLEPGEYRLAAYTNIFPGDARSPVFQQQISIRSAEVPDITVQYVPPLKPAPVSGDTVYFTCKVLTSQNGTAGFGIAYGGELNYRLLADGQRIQSGKIKISNYGEVNLAVKRLAVFGKKTELVATVTYQKKKTPVRTRIPLFNNTASVRFYPGGGNLVNGQATAMALEIRNMLGAPVATTGELREDGNTIAVFETDTYGAAVTGLTPIAGKQYTIALADTSLRLIYDFPVILKNGYALHVPHPVVKGNVLNIEAGTPAAGANCYLLLHNYRTAFYSWKLVVDKTRSQVKLPVEDVPDGVATLTLFDAAGRPQAERAVYFQRHQPLVVRITADSAQYHSRSKVKLQVRVTDAAGKPVKAVFSLACVLNNRLDTTRFTDIVRCNYFDRFLPQYKALPPPAYFTNENNIVSLLLTRYWTRYRWNDVQQAAPLTGDGDLPFLTGQVYQHGRKVKLPTEMLLVADSVRIAFITDSSGGFELPSNAFKLGPGRKGYVTVNAQKLNADYRLDVTQALAPVNAGLSNTDFGDAIPEKIELVPQEKQFIRSTLQNVTVVADRDNRFSNGIYRSDDCNDFVCPNNILNCPNHKFGVTPVSGVRYRVAGRGFMIYLACDHDTMKPVPFMQYVKGTYYPKEFYVADYEKYSPPEPEMMSTIFWNHAIHTNAAGEASLQFFTNDLNGHYICVLQGISRQGVLSGKHDFRVVR